MLKLTQKTTMLIKKSVVHISQVFKKASKKAKKNYGSVSILPIISKNVNV